MATNDVVACLGSESGGHADSEPLSVAFHKAHHFITLNL